ncbi:MAG TPA: sigma-70 family RNA polymerase sigma factor [Gemmatimonadaceae bacterium]|nr:sigma-70 family RNA polymerase sigma factor [Gemmatimonadaceae bacterium]
MRASGAIDLNGDQLTLLVTAAQQDETRALDKLLSTVRPALFSYFARRVPEDLADDLAQIALIRIVKALPRIDPTRASGFIGTIGQNLLRTAFRRQARDARRVAPSITPDELESGVTADQEVDLQDLLDAVMRASSRTLTHELRDVVTALLRGEDRADIAAKQGISQITVRTRLMRARVILREELGEVTVISRDSPTSKAPRTTRLIPE